MPRALQPMLKATMALANTTEIFPAPMSIQGVTNTPVENMLVMDNLALQQSINRWV